MLLFCYQRSSLMFFLALPMETIDLQIKIVQQEMITLAQTHVQLLTVRNQLVRYTDYPQKSSPKSSLSIAVAMEKKPLGIVCHYRTSFARSVRVGDESLTAFPACGLN